MKRKSDDYSDYYMSTQEIADTLGVSKQRVQQIIEGAFKKLERLIKKNLMKYSSYLN